MDFILVLLLIEVFLLGVMAESLQAINCSKWGILLQRGPVDPKFQVEGSPPRTILLRKLG